ncbi:MAG: PorP/SprF family type IX secretion system membrane protein [Saprospiraceae bacterium]
MGMLFGGKVINLCTYNVVGMKHIAIFLLFMVTWGAQSQDIHFSQFYMSPTNLNPALTGVMNCKMRFVANYRNQWAPVLGFANSFNTYNLSFDQKVPVGRYDYFGFGGTFWGDKAGSLDFSTLQFKLSGSYSKRMSGSRTSANYLVFGAEAGLNQRGVKFHNAIWGTQISTNGIDPNGTKDPAIFDPSFLFADVSVGLLWFSVLDKYSNFYVGGAFSHLNEPLQNNIQSGTPGYIPAPLYSKLTIHGGGVFELSRKNSINPGIVAFFQGPSFELNAGTSFRFGSGTSRTNEQSFQLGLWTRLANKYKTADQTGIHMDALILSARFDYNKYGFGLSYDVNTSSLKKANAGNNSFELSFIYNVCGPERRGIYCPNF